MDKTMYEFKKEALKRKVWKCLNKVKEDGKELIKWGMDHPAEAIAILGITAGTVKKVSNAVETVAENRRREMDIYDPHTGMHHKLKQPLTARQKVEFEQRTRRGEGYASVLSDMNVLRR